MTDPGPRRRALRVAPLLVALVLIAASGLAAAANHTGNASGTPDGDGPGADESLRADVDARLDPWAVVLVGLALVLLAGVFVQRLRASVIPPENPTKELTLMEHLEELQQRLVTVLVGWGFMTLFFFSFGPGELEVAGTTVPVPVPTVHGSYSALVLDHLRLHFVPDYVQVIVYHPVDAVYAQLAVTVLLGLVVASPLVAYEIGAFLAPGLLEEERRFLLRLLPLVTVLFLLGVLFAYTLMIPITMDVLYGYATNIGVTEQLLLPELVSFVTILMVLFGVAFELPVVMVALVELGITTPDAYVEYWRHAVVVIAVLAAIASDPSIVSQALVGGPLVGLYGIGILASRWRYRKRQERLP